MKTARLFLVDDNADNLEVLAILLREAYTVFTYGSAVEALRDLPSIKPDLLVLDIGMPTLDGVQCLQAIRAMPGWATIPAIAVTAFARDVERKAFLEAGFQAVVTKPVIDQQELFDAIERLLT